MTRTVLDLFALVSALLGVSGGGSFPLPPSRRARFTATGVEGVRKLRRETKAALHAATTLLR